MVVFTNKKVACDITITKIIDMTYGTLPESEYSRQAFTFNIVLTGLGTKKYNEIMVEYTKENATGSVRKTLAEVMGMSQSQGQQTVASTVSFTVTLHHKESLKLRNMPFGATCFVTEQASNNYIASYTINCNDGALLQTVPQANTERNIALSLSAAETIDTNDTDIEFVFKNEYEFDPYVLPAAGTSDARPLRAVVFGGFLFFAAAFIVVSKKRKNAEA